MRQSKFGFGLRCIQQNEDAAIMLGINTPRYKVAAFTLSAVFPGLCGGIYASWVNYIDPTDVYDVLLSVKPMRAVFYPEYVRRLHGTHVKRGSSKADMVAQLRQDIRSFIRDNGCDRAVAVWCGSTEIYTRANGVHSRVSAFEQALAKSDPSITNSQMYTWALLKERVPFANGSVGTIEVARPLPPARFVGLVHSTSRPACSVRPKRDVSGTGPSKVENATT